MPKWTQTLIGLSFSFLLISIAYKVLRSGNNSARLSRVRVDISTVVGALKIDTSSVHLRSEFTNDSSAEYEEEISSLTSQIEELKAASVPEELDLGTQQSKSISPQENLKQPVVRSEGFALVYDPPSNVRASPNGTIICSVTSKGAVPIYTEEDGWYRTDICGEMGVIHHSQLSFDSNSIR